VQGEKARWITPPGSAVAPPTVKIESFEIRNCIVRICRIVWGARFGERVNPNHTRVKAPSLLPFGTAEGRNRRLRGFSA
jgi:hypothetical protein